METDSDDSDLSFEENVLENPYVLHMMFGAQERAPKWRYDRLDWERHVQQLLHTNTFHLHYRMRLETFNIHPPNELKKDIVISPTDKDSFWNLRKQNAALYIERQRLVKFWEDEI